MAKHPGPISISKGLSGTFSLRQLLDRTKLSKNLSNPQLTAGADIELSDTVLMQRTLFVCPVSIGCYFKTDVN